MSSTNNESSKDPAQASDAPLSKIHLRGFGTTSRANPKKHSEMSRKAGRIAHKGGKAHKFNADEARAAARIKKAKKAMADQKTTTADPAPNSEYLRCPGCGSVQFLPIVEHRGNVQISGVLKCVECGRRVVPPTRPAA